MSTATLGLTQFFARAVVQARFAQLDDTTLAQARMAIADCIACAMAGSRDASADALAAVLAKEQGDCTLWGRHERADAHVAALINGTAAHMHALDDTNESMRGHPSVVIWPAVAALGEFLNVGGEDLLLAYCVGVEVAAKLGRCVNDQHSRVGWHTTSTLGPVGAAAAAACLLRLDEAQTAQALGIATSMASGARVNFGTMTKGLHAGWAAHNGVLAAQLASRGFTASTQALEGHEGFVALFCGAEHAKLHAAEQTWAQPWELASPGVVIKQYPTCSLQHALIDMVLDARELGVFNVPDVRLECVISERLNTVRTKGWPANGGSAKFHVEYSVARAAMSGTQGIGDFTDAAVRNEQVKAFADKVQVCVGSELTPGNGDAAVLRVFHGERMVHCAGREKPLGHPRRPLSETAFAAKFMSLAAPILGEQATRELLRNLQALPRISACALAVSAVPAR